MKEFDVIVIGAGLSGIAAGHYLGADCPQKSFCILEGRDAIGGTWDLFRYPGIRSDSDMHTLGYSFYPWNDPKAIADGPSIREYVRETAAHYGLDSKIEFGTRVTSLSWDSSKSLWEITAQKDGDEVKFLANFVWCCSGYYSYDQAYTPNFEGVDTFEGEFIHPQFWPEELDYSNKRVVVIGSGATAVTLVPELAKKASHVVMLQRTPTYVMSLPSVDKISEKFRGLLGDNVGSDLTRWKNISVAALFFGLSKRYPQMVRKFLIDALKEKIGHKIDVERHFSPPYNPWEQRVCFVPDDDLFDALLSEKAEVVTDKIERFLPHGILLKSGQILEADIVVSATGLKVEMLGGAEIFVDSEELKPSRHMLYKGTMVSDVPNLAISIGYTNASWTLKCELIGRWVTRLLNEMDAKGAKVALAPREEGVSPTPLVDFNSGYIRRAAGAVPTQGDRRPWKLYQNYFLDVVSLGHAPIDDGYLEFGGKK